MSATPRPLSSAFLIALGASMIGGPALAQPTPCARSAGDMFRSCAFEVQEELAETRANCRQVEARSDRNACNRQASRDRREAAGQCADQLEARAEACELLGEVRYSDPLLDESIGFVDPDLIGDAEKNSFVSLVAGHTFVLRAGEDLTDGDFEELVVVHVTDEVREIQGVPCRVVADVVVEVGEDEDDGGVDYEAIEVTDDWFAQTANGDVYYCGEVARNFEDGVLRDLDGSFESGIDFAKAGLLIAASPSVDDVHRQEYALGEAEDIIQYVNLATGPNAGEGGEGAVPCNDACLKTFEFAPIEPESTEFKYYVPGTGFVLAVSMEDGEITGEREELVCVGDSLEVLMSLDCADVIADADELLDELCDLHPDAFCVDDDQDE